MITHPTRKLDYIPELDGLRAIAILLVIIYHYGTCQINPCTLNGFGRILGAATSWMWSGVDLFFVLSGFLIGRILLFNKESKNFFRTFYIRRALRISAPYYLVIFLFSIFFLADSKWRIQAPWLTTNLLPIHTYLLYIQNLAMTFLSFGANGLGVTWSLAIEEQFYVLFPVIIYFADKRRLPLIIVTGIILAPFFRMTLPGLGPYVLLPSRMDALLIGALIALLHASGNIEYHTPRIKKYLPSFIACTFILILMMVALGDWGEIGGVVNHSVFALFYGGVILGALICRGSFIGRILTNKPLSFLAKISYSIYLTHQIFSGLLHQLLLNQKPQIDSSEDLLVTVLALLATLVFSSTIYYLLERPLLSFGKRFKY